MTRSTDPHVAAPPAPLSSAQSARRARQAALIREFLASPQGGPHNGVVASFTLHIVADYLHAPSISWADLDVEDFFGRLPETCDMTPEMAVGFTETLGAFYRFLGSTGRMDRVDAVRVASRVEEVSDGFVTAMERLVAWPSCRRR